MMAEPNMPAPESEGTDTEAYAQRMQRRKAIQDRRMAETNLRLTVVLLR